MARSPNDDRSDSKNPNNSAYHASQENHARQTGSADYDDDDDWTPPVRMQSISSPGVQPAVRAVPRVLEVTVTSPVRTMVKGLYLLWIGRQGRSERSVQVDSPSVEEAMREVQAWCESGDLAYLVLYDKEKVHFEYKEEVAFDAGLAENICAIGDLYGLVRIAEGCLGNARKSVDACLGQERSHSVMATLRELGCWKAAVDELRSELLVKLAALAKRGFVLAEEHLPEISAQAKRALLATQCFSRIHNPVSGMSSRDMYMALTGAQTITSLRRP
jgi:hypothetical protein